VAGCDFFVVHLENLLLRVVWGALAELALHLAHQVQLFVSVEDVYAALLLAQFGAGWGRVAEELEGGSFCHVGEAFLGVREARNLLGEGAVGG
jgi:hypothetical protein